MLPEEGVTVAVSVMPNANVKPQSYPTLSEVLYLAKFQPLPSIASLSIM